MQGAESIISALKAQDNIIDYQLYFQAILDYLRAHYHSALVKIDVFRDTYPDSYLRDDLEYLKFLVYTKLYRLSDKAEDKERALQAMKTYCQRHPENQDALYALSSLIKKEQPQLFQSLIKRLLISADKYYDYAHQFTDPLGLSAKEFLRLIYNLHRSLRYREALRLLTYWKEQNPWDKRFQITLADTYYRLRRYEQAARLYEETRRYKHAALSYFRAHDQDGLERLVNISEHLRGLTPCIILILRGRQLRDTLEFEKALSYLRKAYRKYDQCKEDALWEIGWIEYLQGQYLHAAYNFRDLFLRYKDPRYLYWLKKTNSYLKLNELNIKDKIPEESFYHAIIRFNRNSSNYLLSPADYNIILNRYLKDYFPPSDMDNRLNVLKKAGLADYIKREILHTLNRSRQDIEGYVYALLKYGFYRDAMKVARGNIFSDGKLKKVATYPLSYRDYVFQVSSGLSFDPLLLLSVMRVESHFDKEALSRSGAKGLMQLMDFTARRWAEKEGIQVSFDEDSESSIFRPEINIRLGAVYLRWLLDKFKNPFLAVAAYNAGENAVSRWLKELKYNGLDEFLELIPYEETRYYVKKVFSTYETYRKIYLMTKKRTSATNANNALTQRTH